MPQCGHFLCGSKLIKKTPLLVTGATGFIGRAVCAEVLGRGMWVRGSTRSECKLINGVENLAVGGLEGRIDWRDALNDCQAVVHLAARAHVMKEAAVDPLNEFRHINVQGTLNLARQAAEAGVRRFVFISSIGVNGAETFQRPFNAEDEVAPHSPYAVSKYEAEMGLLSVAVETGLEVVIIRPPLVYGPNAPGNFGVLIHWLRRGVPLPLGSIYNQRSLVALDNLVDFIITCITHPQAVNQIFLVSDGQDLSTTELVRGMAQADGVSARLLPVPVWALQAGASLLGKGDAVQSLCGNLQVDISKARSLLGWVPPMSVEEGLRRAMAV